MAKKRLWILVLILLFLLGAIITGIFILSRSEENVYRNAQLVQGPKAEEVEAYLRLEETLK